MLEGVRLSPGEAARSRMLLIDARGRVLAASDRQGELTEIVALDRRGKRAGMQRDAQGRLVAFHLTPAYETYAGLDWAGVIVQSPP